MSAQMQTKTELNKAGSNVRGACAECFTLAWVAGMLSAFLHASAYVLPCIAAGFGILAALKKLPRGKALLPLIVCVCLGLCGGMLRWTLYDRTMKQPLCALDQSAAVCTGYITETEQYASDRMRYTLRTTLAGRRVSVDWYAGSDVPRLRIGDRVTLDASLTRIPADYRYHTQSYQAGLGRYLRIYDADVLEIRADTGFSLLRTLRDYRGYITGIMQRQLPADESALLYAMLYGDTAFLSDGASSALYQTGIGHITAVSGLHLVFFGALIMRILKRLRFSSRQIFLGTAVTILLFTLTVDASVSVVRAGAMLLLSLGAGLVGRYGDALRSLCLVMFACTALSPYVIGSVSFWLSVSGTFGICVAAPYMTKNLAGPRILRHFAELCVVAVSVFPVSVLLLGESSLLSPVCNLLIVPLGMAALYLGFSLVLTGGLTAFLLPLAGLLCRLVLVIAQAAARLPFSHLTLPETAVQYTVAGGAVLLLLLLGLRVRPLKIGAAASAVMLVLALMTGAARMQAAKELRVAVLGAEKQAVLVVSCEGHVIIADLSGAVRNPQYVRRYCNDMGISHADALILPTGRNAAAYQECLSTITIGAVWLQTDMPFRVDGTICGAVPAPAADGKVVLESGVLTVTCEKGALTAEYRGQTLAAVPAGAEVQTADAVVRWGNPTDAADICAVHLTPAEDGNNVLLRLSEGGVRAEVLLHGE